MIVDILVSDITQVGQSDFTATTPGDIDLPVNGVTAPEGLTFANPAGSCFQLGDNIQIQKLWCVIPWGFGQGGAVQPAGAYLHYVNIRFYDGTAFEDIAPIFAGVLVPTLCDPLTFEGNSAFCRMPTTGQPRNLALVDIQLRVSQINLPPELDGIRIPVQYFVQVAHTLPLTVRV